MRIAQKNFRTIWSDPRCKFVEIIDQTKLPFAFEIARIDNVDKMVQAIKAMQVRGAPLIGVAAAYGIALATLKDDTEAHVLLAAEKLNVVAQPQSTWLGRSIACWPCYKVLLCSAI